MDDADRPVELDDAAGLDAFVAANDPALVMFYTSGCTICASMDPVLDAVARSTDAAVATINPRDDPPLIERFDVQSVPLLVLFREGAPVARRADGFVPIAEATDFVSRPES